MIVTLEGSGYFGTILYFQRMYNQWIHLILTYTGPNQIQGLRLYKDGTLVDLDSFKSAYMYTTGDGRVVVGKNYIDTDDAYTSVEIDELIFFNQALLDDNAKDLYSLYQ